tara:strand:- start:142 stop:957 length:816 start_codon:yes stop_codon:yes gene_type:complete
MNEEDESLKESEMKEKLQKIFNFLKEKENRKYNIEIQRSFFNSVLMNKKSEKEKLISLLYFIAETQSQGSIDNLSKSYEKFHKLEEVKFKTWKDFCCSIGPQNSVRKYQFESQPFAYLFNAIKSNPGYGDKTSALFVRMIFQIHHIDKYEEYKIWDDVPKLDEDDILFLPVDKVITEIFKKISPPTDGSWNFKKINTKLNELYQGSEIEIWDDLWFWGYITQKVVKNQDHRDFELNKAKYWVMKESNKTKQTINEIFEEKGKAQKFIDIIK